MTEYGSWLFLAPFKIVITALVTFPENQNLSLEDNTEGGRGKQIQARSCQVVWSQIGTLVPRSWPGIVSGNLRRLGGSFSQHRMRPCFGQRDQSHCEYADFQRSLISRRGSSYNWSSSNRGKPINLLISDRNKMPISSLQQIHEMSLYMRTEWLWHPSVSPISWVFL